MARAKFVPHPGKQTEFLASVIDRIFYGGARGGAHTLDSLVLTPFGFKRMGDIQIGSQVSNPDGSVSRVINVIPRGLMPIWEITFIDGAKTRVTEDHLWLIKKTCSRLKAKRSYYPFSEDERVNAKIWQTKDIIEFFRKKESAPEGSHIKNQNLLIPLSEPVSFTVSYKYDMRPVDPYVLGVLLGDGCITKRKTACFTNIDDEVVQEVERRLGQKLSSAGKISYRIKDGETLDGLERLSLIGTFSYNKFIPQSYLYSSIESRTDLLSGLLDTDGMVDKRGHISYATVSEELAKNVQFLVRSLGGKATISKNPAGYKDDEGKYIKCRDVYNVYIRIKSGLDIVFLSRKKDRLVEGFNGGASELQRRIVSIKELRPEKAQCITVDNPNGLYICDDFIVTHNSKSFSLAWKAAFQPRVYYYVHESRRITREEFFVLQAAGKHPKFIVEKMSIHYPDYIGILIRRTHPQLQRNLKPETDKLYKQYGGVWKERHNCYVFPSGAKIYLVHCIDRKALDDYIGGNYNFIGIDEANMFPEDWVTMLETSLRTDNPEIVPQLCLTSNPGNLGHTWLKKNYVDKCTPIPNGPKIYHKEFDVWHQPYHTAPPYVDSEGILRQFIPATVFDNPSLIKNDKNYVRKLKQLNPTMRAMWLEGRWDVFAGMFFDMWDPAKHIISGKAAEKFQKFGTKDFNQNTHTLFRFYDYGTKAPFVCLFAAIDKNGRLVIFDEIVEKGLASTAQAQEVNEYTDAVWSLGPKDFADDICDPSFGFMTSEKDGDRYSPLMHYEDEGIILTTAARDRKIAAKVVYNGLSGRNPNIRFTENCEYMIETIPNLPQKENFIEDVEDKGTDDHGYDALKYGATEVLEGGGTDPEPKKKGWRDELEEYQREVANSVDGSWMGI